MCVAYLSIECKEIQLHYITTAKIIKNINFKSKSMLIFYNLLNISQYDYCDRVSVSSYTFA